MKRIVAVILIAISVVASAAALVEGDQVLYMAGTMSTVAPGTMGKIDLSSATTMRFVGGNGAIEIPYKNVTKYSVDSEVAHHIGVLPAIAVGLLKARHRQHFLHIAFTDEKGTVQTLEFEISKQMPRMISDLLQARVPPPPKTECTTHSRCRP